MVKTGPRGRWKDNKQKKRKFVERSLKWARDKPLATIGRRANVDKGTVYKLNARWGIRDPVEVAETARKSHKGAPKRRKKVGFFSRKKKWQLIDENIGAILSKALRWWKLESIRKQFENIENFLKATKAYVFEQLDYYDPNMKGPRGGKPRTVGNYIGGGAELFCRITNEPYWKEKKARKAFAEAAAYTPSSRNDRLITPANKVFAGIHASVKTPRMITFLSAQIPKNAKVVLRRLGIKVEDAAVLGFKEIKAQLIAIAKDPKTGLTLREQRIVHEMLEGERLKDIGKQILNQKNRNPISRQYVSKCLSAALVKVNHRLKEKEERREKRRRKVV